MAMLTQQRWLAIAGRWCCVLALLFSASCAWADAGLVERQVKAAYLYKFASFVEWPEGSFSQPGAQLTIGVAGNDALAEQLDYVVAGRKINGRCSIAVDTVNRL